MSELAHPTTAELKRFIGFLSGYSKVQELQGKIIPGGDHLRGASIRGW